MRANAAIFVLPATTDGQQGPVASWVSTAGWARATERLLGAVWIVTPSGLLDPEGAADRGSNVQLSSDTASPWRRRLPTIAKTAVKDLRGWQRARRFRVNQIGPWTGRDIGFVWQRHELFHTAGLDLARALGVPSVVFAPATLVWESEQWAVGRPGWGRRLERIAERPALTRADLVACGSDLVAEQALRIGVDRSRILVTPTGVDLDRFAERGDAGPLRRRLGLAERFVVGWVGSFRPFHALDLAVDAVSGIPDAALLLVGDGPERSRIERLARDRRVHAVFTGTVPHAEMPRYLAAMDVGLVLARPDQAFHYSPLKLAEYLAAGLPVLAPRVAQLTSRLTDGVEALLVPAGDPGALAASLRRLHDDPGARRRIGAAARAAATDRWSWDHEVERVMAVLGRLRTGSDQQEPGF
jgi:glycosyltransferase involved in cell wall biosynthesis